MKQVIKSLKKRLEESIEEVQHLEEMIRDIHENYQLVRKPKTSNLEKSSQSFIPPLGENQGESPLKIRDDDSSDLSKWQYNMQIVQLPNKTEIPQRKNCFLENSDLNESVENNQSIGNEAEQT